ncbi:MAG: phospholipase family protein [Moraxellaceae bacterium]|jgi:putative cardiolipin synthase|nr:phospholipase family protein [Moraxellaceae bacterium]
MPRLTEAAPLNLLLRRCLPGTMLCFLLAGCTTAPPVLPERGGVMQGRFTPNRVEMLIAGNDALAARLELIDQARQRIVFQYYIFLADDAGRLVADALLRAADRGVEVRGLVDDMHGADNRLLKSLNAHPRIQIRRYKPFRLEGLRLLETVLDFRRVGRRMHNKQLTVDGAKSIVGGRNIGDEYFGTSPDVAFADLDVVIAGPAVAELERSFDDYWSAPHSKARGGDDPERLQKLRAALAQWEVTAKPALQGVLERSAWRRERQAGQLLRHHCPALVLADFPEKLDSARPDSPVARQIALRLQQSREDVLLISSYFVPGEAGVQTLGEVAQRKVRVTVVTNSLASTDVPAVHAGYARYRVPLLRAGVVLWETRPLQGAPEQSAGLGESRATLHTKAYFFDRRYLFVGSFNLDPRSAALNTEMGLLFDCPALAGPVTAALAQALPALAYRVVLDDSGALGWESRGPGGIHLLAREPEAGAWRRFQVWWLQWLPIESEL